jgi:hypothetical protein
MIKIAIWQAAFESIARTLPFGSVSFENKTDENGERLIWLERRWLDRLRKLSRAWRELQRRHIEGGAGGCVMAKTNDIARLIVDEFEAIEDYRLKDHARIVAKVEQTVRARYPA